MEANGVWILQKGVYEGKETCQTGLYMWYFLHFTNTRKKKETLPGSVNSM